MTTDRYNGWTNRETWVTHLLLSNSENCQRYWDEEIRSLRRRFDDDGEFRFTIADRLQEEHETALEAILEEPRPYHAETLKCLFDIGSLWRVNWLEIADALLEE
jgi:hypothetical protein